MELLRRDALQEILLQPDQDPEVQAVGQDGPDRVEDDEATADRYASEMLRRNGSGGHRGFLVDRDADRSNLAAPGEDTAPRSAGQCRATLTTRHPRRAVASVRRGASCTGTRCRST